MALTDCFVWPRLWGSTARYGLELCNWDWSVIYVCHSRRHLHVGGCCILSLIYPVCCYRYRILQHLCEVSCVAEYGRMHEYVCIVLITNHRNGKYRRKTHVLW